MKSRIIASNRSREQTPSSITCNRGTVAAASASPVVVRQGLNHSFPAVSVPTRAFVPSEIMSNSFMANSEGNSSL